MKQVYDLQKVGRSLPPRGNIGLGYLSTEFAVLRTDCLISGYGFSG